MDKKLLNLIKVAIKLDESGNYKLSDKVYNFIKTAQSVGMQTPAEYKSVRPSSNIPALGLFEDLRDSSFGYHLAGGQYDAQAPGKFGGPDAPLIQRTLSPTEYAAMEKFDPTTLARMQVEEGLRSQLYMAQSGASFANLGRLVSQWLGPDVSPEKQKSFKSYVLPNVMTSTISTILSSTPMPEWESKLEDFERTAIKASPNHATDITNAIKISIKKTIEDLKFKNAVKYQELLRNPQYRSFATRYSIR